METIKPYFSENNIPLFFAADDAYALYFGVTLQSLINNSSPQYNYDILLLDNGICKFKKNHLKKQIAHKENFSLRFLGTDNLFADIKAKEHAYISVTTYARFFIPQLCAEYEKVIYLDCDLVIKDDVAKLYQLNIGDNYIAAAPDFGIESEIARGTKEYAEYKTNTLIIPSTQVYVNAGVLIFNLLKWKSLNLAEKCLALIPRHDLFFGDQCIINMVCMGNIYPLDIQWNYTTHLLSRDEAYFAALPQGMGEKYLSTIDCASIIHYTTGMKPWNTPSIPLSAAWWELARNMPYYEELLFQNLTTQKQTAEAVSSYSLKTYGEASVTHLFGVPFIKTRRSLTALKVDLLGVRVFKKEKHKDTTQYSILGLKIFSTQVKQK